MGREMKRRRRWRDVEDREKERCRGKRAVLLTIVKVCVRDTYTKSKRDRDRESERKR